GQQEHQRNARNRREIRFAGPQRDFFQRPQQFFCRRVHVIPERMFAEVDVAVQQMQRQQRGNQKFPDEITTQRDDQRFFNPVRRRHHRSWMQPRERPACQRPNQRNDRKRQKEFYPARPAVNLSKLHFHQPVGWHWPAQKGQQQQPQINDSKHPRETENGKQKHLAENSAAEINRGHAHVQFPNPARRRTDFPVKQRAQQQQAAQRRGQMPAPRIRRLGAAQRAEQGGGLRLAERIRLRGAPVQPQQQTREIQDEVNQAHGRDA